MANWNRQKLKYLAIGCVVGLVAGLNLRGLWPNVPLHAYATHGFDNFAIATGLIDNEIEALYFLDFLTGDLKAAVLNQRTGDFGALFHYNVAKDFAGAAGAKNPRYLMVTGLANIPRGRAGFQLGMSAVYIAEANSAQVIAYVIPWNSSLNAAGKPQQGEFVAIGKLQLRTAIVRDQ
jgi:hypothetical protein